MLTTIPSLLYQSPIIDQSIDWRAEGPQLVRKARLFLIKTLAQLSLQRALEHAAIVCLSESSFLRLLLWWWLLLLLLEVEREHCSY